MSIIVENVSKKYANQYALKNVSFKVNKGEIVGFLGPNGAGKSTMMKIISCFIPQSEGKVKVCGFDIEDNSIEVRKRVAYLPELNPLYYDMYVRESLNFICGIYKLKNKKKLIDEIIKKVGLEKESNKKISMLSKGFKQRIGLAQALIHNPEVLILDEPTSGLDPNQIIEIRQLIKEAGKEKTVILSTHIMQEVEAICDRIIIINEGRIIADASKNDITKLINKESIFVVEFNELVNKKEIAKINGIDKVENVNDFNKETGNVWKIYSKQGKDIRNSLFNFAVSKNIAIITLNKEELKLEDIFKKLTRN